MPRKGKALFTGTCASCHKLGALGKSEVGPPLNGMGAHGRAGLLSHIIDPNREVDPSFWQWNVTTKKGETLAGVIASENASGLTLRNTNGDVEIKKEDIATRENTRLSLMPEGLEAIGAEALRDILTFVVADGASSGAARRPEVPHHRPARGLYGRQPSRDAPRRRARRDGDAAPLRRRLGRGRAVLRHGPGAVAERLEPRRPQGRAGHRQSLRRVSAARRDSDDRHGREPAFPRRRRRRGPGLSGATRPAARRR